MLVVSGVGVLILERKSQGYEEIERVREGKLRRGGFVWRQMEREREKLCKANGVGAATGILRVNE
jgi:hypothetical protein